MRYFFAILLLLTGLLFVSCLEPSGRLDIEDKIVYPNKIVSLGKDHFLLLNSDAATEHKTGSIHRYKVSREEVDPHLEHVFEVPNHGSDMALSKDNKLLVLGFDGSKPETQLFFYDFSNPNTPIQLESLTLKFAKGGGKQSIKELHFFEVETKDHKFDNDYFLYGVILNSPLDTGKGDNIPARSFVARVSRDFSSSEVLFVLSYGVGDEQLSQALSPKSDSLTPTFEFQTQYMIGSSAPVFDPVHNFFIALPTGSMNGYNDTHINEYPELPYDVFENNVRQESALQYFSGQKRTNLNCEKKENCVQPDLRAVSVFVVDMVDYLNNHRDNVNASLYFSPLAWNLNGIPYNRQTKSGPLVLGAGDSVDIKSLTFQYNFWASYMQPDGSLLIAKKGENGAEDKDGNGNEVFRLSGIDDIEKNIQYAKELLPVTSEEAKDFKKIASRQIFDMFHELTQEQYQAGTKGLEKKSNVIVPYIFARTTDEVSLKAPTAVHGFDTVCLDANDDSTCSTYWIRSSYLGFNGQGRDTSWLTVALPQESYKPGDNPFYPDAIRDPSNFTTYKMPQLSGAFVCTTLEKTDIYCVNYLSGEFVKFNITLEGFSKWEKAV